MKDRRLIGSYFALGGALAAGCLSLDDRELSVTQDIVLGTFEDMTEQPPDARFSVWTAGVINGVEFTVHLAVVPPGFNSRGCLQLDWEMIDPANGVVDYVSATEHTRVGQPIDLRDRGAIVLTHQYANGGPCLPLDRIYVRLMCGALASGYEMSFPVSAAWRTTTLEFVTFYEVPYLAHGVALDDCLRVADEFQIMALPDIQDGECSSGTLQVDDVSIR
jgi:hypothetical protein